MKFIGSTFALAMAATSLLWSSALAAPAGRLAGSPVEKRNDVCQVNASIVSSWQESAMQRYKIAFSTTKEGANMGDACQYWGQSALNCAALNNNVQCYVDDSVGPVGSWVIDVNEAIGPAGDNAISCQYRNFMSAWTTAWTCPTAHN